jgi:phospholipid/cholesterol/gamma-HCH transport system ATP-binding protein
MNETNRPISLEHLEPISSSTEQSNAPSSEVPSDQVAEAPDHESAGNDHESKTHESETDEPIQLASSNAPQTDGKPLVTVEEVNVTFEGQTILSGISRTIARGQTVAVIGESGCGKTVFMKTLVALLQPTHGSVLFDGVDLNQLSPMELAQVRRRFGFVFQHAALFDSMNIYDNVAFPIRQNEPAVTESEVRERVRNHLNEVGLPDEVARKFPAEISGGMQKRVGLARALVLQPELIVYDEPTTGLDPIMSDVINELILHTRRLYPVTSVVVTHDMHTARKVADRVMMFYPRHMLQPDESQILFDGPPSQLEHSEDRRVRQFVRGEAGERLREMTRASA